MRFVWLYLKAHQKFVCVCRHCNASVFVLQVRGQLDLVYDRLTGFSEVGISPAHAEHILKELTTHEERTCVSIFYGKHCLL